MWVSIAIIIVGTEICALAQRGLGFVPLSTAEARRSVA